MSRTVAEQLVEMLGEQLPKMDMRGSRLTASRVCGIANIIWVFIFKPVPNLPASVARKMFEWLRVPKLCLVRA